MDDRLFAARENLIETYWRLGLTVGDLTNHQQTPFRLLTSPRPLSVANMALDFQDRDPALVQAHLVELRKVAARYPSFRVLSCDGDPVDLVQFAPTVGMEVENRLHLLTAASSCQSGLVLSEATEENDRVRIAEFMVDQFPHRRNPSLRELIVRANSQAKHRLFFQGVAAHPQAALMLSETPNGVGLYNLCVTPKLRGQGLGSQLFGWAEKWARERTKPLVLQSFPQLLPFYERQGCVVVGEFRALRLR